MVALLGALKQEITDVRKRMTVTENVSEDTCTIFRGTWHGREILLAQTGMGKQRAQAATRHLVEHYPITRIISLGFAGALTDELRVGDVILYSAVHCSDAEVSQQGAYCSGKDLLARVNGALKHVAVNSSCRPGVTVSHAVLSYEEKHGLDLAFNASVVDMESYWIAEIAAEQQIPFVILRSVSDTNQEKMLPIGQLMTEDGNVLWREAAGYFLRRPHHLAVVGRLYRNAKQAAWNLAAAIDEVIREL
jgi:5'-methylthioadenosine/S-adenosylhomocysteine nucleosidase